MIWQVSSKSYLQPIWKKINVKRGGNGVGGVNTTKTAAGEYHRDSLYILETVFSEGMGILKKKKTFLHSLKCCCEFKLFFAGSSFQVLSIYFPTCSLIFFSFWFHFRVEWYLLPSPNHCTLSQISPWMCGFLMAFLISIPVPITSLSKLALKKPPKFSFSFSSESLYLILSETLWLILFSLLSPLVHKASMKGLSSKKLSE